jgi:hypothetical protein
MNTTPKRTSTKAVVSAVAGLLGWTALPLLGTLVAIVAGHLARAEIRRDPESVEGDLWAVIGLVLGWGQVVLTVLSVLLVVLFFGSLAAFLGWLGYSGQLG